MRFLCCIFFEIRKVKEEELGTKRKTNKTVLQNEQQNSTNSSTLPQNQQVKIQDSTRPVPKQTNKTTNSLSTNPSKKPKKEENYFDDDMDEDFMKNIDDDDFSNKLEDDIDELFFCDNVSSSDQLTHKNKHTAVKSRNEPAKKIKGPVESDLGDFFDDNEDADIFNVEENSSKKHKKLPKTPSESDDVSDNFNLPEKSKDIPVVQGTEAGYKIFLLALLLNTNFIQQIKYKKKNVFLF